MQSYVEEHFPHLVPQLVAVWGRPEAFKALVSGLLFDTRGGRAGWPPEAWEEIAFLEALHAAIHPEGGRTPEDDELDDSVKWVS